MFRNKEIHKLHGEMKACARLGRMKPFKLFENVYFVGTYQASSHIIDTGEGLDQQSLSVIHMAGGADDHMLHWTASPIARTILGTSSCHNVRTSSRYRPSWIRPIIGIMPRRSFCSNAFTSPSRATAQEARF